MELKEILKFIKKNLRLLLLFMFLFGAAGVLAYYFLPTKHYATGSLFIRRSIYPYSENHFTYEGFYGQQAAMFYSNSVVGLIESEDIRAQVLTSLSIPVNEKTLRQYENKIRTIKSGPQLIGLVTKGDSPQQAEELWNAVADSTIGTMNSISRINDPFVGIIKVSEKPILKESFRDLPIFALAGIGLGFILPVGGLALISYLKSTKKK